MIAKTTTTTIILVIMWYCRCVLFCYLVSGYVTLCSEFNHFIHVSPDPLISVFALIVILLTKPHYTLYTPSSVQYTQFFLQNLPQTYSHAGASLYKAIPILFISFHKKTFACCIVILQKRHKPVTVGSWSLLFRQQKWYVCHPIKYISLSLLSSFLQGCLSVSHFCSIITIAENTKCVQNELM